MTLTLDPERAAKSLVSLARARQADFPEEDLRVYLHVLRVADPGAPSHACQTLAALPRPEFGSAMPSAGEILNACKGAALERRIAQRAETYDPAQMYRCYACRDAGWLIHQCAAGPAPACGRRPDTGEWLADGKQTYRFGPCAAPHPYATRCSCAATG